MKEIQQTGQQETATAMSRRRFFGLAGGVAGAGLLLGTEGCKKGKDDNVDLGSGDNGILNFAYALEQVEAAFYSRVVQNPFNGMTAMEKDRLKEIRDHEIAHREFFKAALAGVAIRELDLNFGSIDFKDRDSVLGAARKFEDLGVSAYNGAGKLFSSPDYLLLAGKIVSVEARHAAYIRDIANYGTFAGNDVVDINGLEISRSPAAVMAILQPYLFSQLNIGGLPTS